MPRALGFEATGNTWERVAPFVRRHALRVGVTLVLAFVSLRSVLQATGGAPAVPLDDAFIHFQYARSFWEGRGLGYTPGAEPAAGATSLLWPLLLAVPYGLGLRGEAIIWAAWAFGWAAFALLAYETRRMSERLLSADGALGAELMVLSFGGYVWFAASGMEVLPLAWLTLLTMRSAAEWAEGENARRRRTLLLLLAWLVPLVRPEGVLSTAAAALALGWFSRGRERAWSALALAGAAGPALVNLLLAGTTTTTTAVVKWLPLSPYWDSAGLERQVLENVRLLFGTLLDGEVWSAVFLPQGFGLLFWGALPAVWMRGAERGAHFRAGLVVWMGLGMLIPATYDSFLWNRLRYLWPFAAAWFIGLAALADGLGALASRLGREWERLRLLGSGVVVGAFATHLPWTVDDLATSANAIRAQQAELGHWAADALPADAVIGVNDTGAIAYFSGRRTFDVVGLTTAGEARYWAAGAGSRFEHYERVDRARLPSHFIVYPEWFAIPSLLGDFLTERSVPGATILGGVTMRAHAADYRALGSGARPVQSSFEPCEVLDELDVADLESEAAHRYELFDATTADNVALAAGGVADGARRRRTRERFELRLAPSGRLLARLHAERDVSISVRAHGADAGRFALSGGILEEVELSLPASLRPGVATVEVTALGPAFASLHYWSCRPAP